MKVLRIAFRGLGRKGVRHDHAYRILGPRGEQAAAALRISAASRRVPGAGGEVTVAVPLMTAPPAVGPPGGAGEAVRRETRHGSQIRYVQRIYAPMSGGARACSRRPARTRSAASTTSRDSRWHASSPVLSSVHSATSPMADLAEDRPMAGPDRPRNPRGSQ
jgi:hypothetical protein